MKRVSILLACMAGIAWMVLYSCRPDPPLPSRNKAPVANAGVDRVIDLPADSVWVDGTASTDPDGVIEEYQWKLLVGNGDCAIQNPMFPKTCISHLCLGLYEFELTVVDDGGLSSKDTVQVIVRDPTVSNQPPVANAGPDQTIELPENSVVLDGYLSVDPDANIIAYKWSKIAGPPECFIATPNQVRTSVSGLVAGVYNIELEVTDAGGLSARDSVLVRVNPIGSGNCDLSGRPQLNPRLTKIGELSVARSPAVAAAGNKVVFAGGIVDGENRVTDAVDIYDMSTRLWTTTKLSKPRAYIAAISAGNKIFFAGGVNLSLEEEYDIVDIYDVTTNTWTVEHLSQARGGAVAALVGNKILFVGGWYDGFWAGSRDVDIYDLSSNSWSTATLCVQRWWPAAVTVGSKVYIAGGEGMTNNRRDVDVYDNETNTWSKATLAQNHDGLSAVASGSNIYWAYDGKVEIWNTLNGTSRLECLSSASPAPAARVIGDEVVFIGGESSTSSKYNRFDAYNQSAKTWSMAFLNPDFYEPAIISYNNKLIIAGGDALWRNASSNVYELSW